MDKFIYTTEERYSKGIIDFAFGVQSTADSIKIFLIQDESSRYFAEETPAICLNIIDCYHPEKRLQDISWTYIAGAAQSDLIFEQRNELPIKLKFNNCAVLEPYCAAKSIEEYKSALNDPRGIKRALLDGYPEKFWPTFSREPIIRYLVHTPNHPRFPIHMLKMAYENLPPDDHPVVLVDTQKFINFWKQQCSLKPTGNRIIPFLREMLFSKQGEYVDDLDIYDQQLLMSSIETSLKHPIPDEMACGVKLNNKTKIRYTNGRHRTVNLANLGAKFIPVQSESYQINMFRTLFEWKDIKPC